MKFETVFYQLKRLQTPDEEFSIDWNKNGQCIIRLGSKQFRLNFESKRMYRSDEKVEFSDLIAITEINDLKRFLSRYGIDVMKTTATRRLKGIREVEILFSYLAQYWSIPLTYDVFRCNGVAKTNNGFSLKRGKPLV